MSQGKGRIGIIIFQYYLGVSVSVLETARFLERNGYTVVIYIDEPSFVASPAVFDESNIEVVRVRKALPEGCSGNNRPGAIGRFLKKAVLAAAAWQHQHWPFLGCYGSLKTFLEAYYSPFGSYLEEVGRHMGDHPFVALIGVEPRGLMAACGLRELTPKLKPRLVYFNLELLQHVPGSATGMHILKHMEIVCSRRCEITVIPDEQRGRVFAQANGIPAERIQYLPVGTSGEVIRTKSDYWRQKFPIPADSKIVVYAGNIQQPWTMTREIVASVPSWPKECVLVLHTWKENALSDPYLQEVARLADPKRVFLSTHPVPPTKVPALLTSADIGLAFYRPLDANFQEIGSSSNKLAQYGRVGLPVITNDLSSLRRIFERFGNGLCVRDPAELPDALIRIFGDYETYRKGAFQSYEEHYELTRHLKLLFHDIL